MYDGFDKNLQYMGHIGDKKKQRITEAYNKRPKNDPKQSTVGEFEEDNKMTGNNPLNNDKTPYTDNFDVFANITKANKTKATFPTATPVAENTVGKGAQRNLGAGGSAFGQGNPSKQQPGGPMQSANLNRAKELSPMGNNPAVAPPKMGVFQKVGAAVAKPIKAVGKFFHQDDSMHVGTNIEVADLFGKPSKKASEVVETASVISDVATGGKGNLFSKEHVNNLRKDYEEISNNLTELNDKKTRAVGKGQYDAAIRMSGRERIYALNKGNTMGNFNALGDARGQLKDNFKKDNNIGKPVDTTKNMSMFNK